MTTHVDAYAMEYATLRARLLVATAGFHPQDLEDLRQEILLDYLRRAPRFDPARGDRDAFVRGVMRNHATVLVVRRSRSLRHETLLDDIIPSEESLDRVLGNRYDHSPAEAIELAIDMTRELHSLPEQVRGVAKLLELMSVSDVCRMTGKSRSRIYQIVRELRDVFTEADLRPPPLRRPLRTRYRPDRTRGRE